MNNKTVLITIWVCIFAILFPVFSTVAEELDSTNFKIVDVTTQGGGTAQSTNYSTLLTSGDTITDPRLYSTNYKMTADPASAFRPAVPTVSCFETTTDGYSNCTTGPTELSTGGMVALCGSGGCYNKARFEIGDAPYQYDTSQSNLIGYWPMDETSGSSIENVIGSNNATATGTSIIDGKYRKARSFNGSSDWVQMDGDIGLSGAMTLSFWFYTPTKNSNRYFFDNRDPGTWWFIKNYTGGTCGTIPGNICFEGRVMAQDSDWNINEWTHLVVTDDTTTAKMYINGQLVDTGTGESTSISTNLRIGTRYSNSGYFDGVIDEVLLYNTALNATQVEEIYDSSRHSTNPTDTLYAIQISEDNFASDIRYIDGSTYEPKSTVTLNDFRTKSQWETDTFNILGLQEGTQYYIRIIALHGDFTQTEEGPEETATTAGTSSFFDIDIAGTGGTSTETDPPFSITFTGGNSLLAGAGTVTADNLIWMDAETNGSGGFAIVQRGVNGGLYSTTHSAQIDSVTGNLDSLDEGFGLQSYYIDYSTSSAGDITAMTNYNGSIANVGIVGTDWNKIYDADGPIVTGRMALYVLARAGTDKVGATDYDESITFVFVPRY
jgi:hypothetical protein